ncbi:MAG: hypothetical protein ACE5H3_06180, partial [Planctomycetota bacterium]
TALAAVVEVDNPVALVGALRSPLFGISDTALYRFAQAGGVFNYYLADAGAGHAVLFTPRHLRGFLQAAGFELLSMETRGFRIVQRERDRLSLGWKKPFLRLAENLGHEWGKRTGRGHFLLAIARRCGQAARISS